MHSTIKTKEGLKILLKDCTDGQKPEAVREKCMTHHRNDNISNKLALNNYSMNIGHSLPHIKKIEEEEKY